MKRAGCFSRPFALGSAPAVRQIRNVSDELVDADERGRFPPDITQPDEKKDT